MKRIAISLAAEEGRIILERDGRYWSSRGRKDYSSIGLAEEGRIILERDLISG